MHRRIFIIVLHLAGLAYGEKIMNVEHDAPPTVPIRTPWDVGASLARFADELNPRFRIGGSCHLSSHFPAGAKEEYRFSLRQNVLPLLASWLDEELNTTPPPIPADLNRKMNEPGNFVAWFNLRRNSTVLRLEKQREETRAAIAALGTARPQGTNETRSKLGNHPLHQSLVASLPPTLAGPYRELSGLRAKSLDLSSEIKALNGRDDVLLGLVNTLPAGEQRTNAIRERERIAARLPVIEQEISATNDRAEELVPVVGSFESLEILESINPRGDVVAQARQLLPESLIKWAENNRREITEYLNDLAQGKEMARLEERLNRAQERIRALNSPNARENALLVSQLLVEKNAHPYALVFSLQPGPRGSVVFKSANSFHGKKRPGGGGLIYVHDEVSDEQEVTPALARRYRGPPDGPYLRPGQDPYQNPVRDADFADSSILCTEHPNKNGAEKPPMPAE